MFSTEKITELNKIRLALIHPSVASRVTRLLNLAREENYNLLVTQGLRTFAEQDALYA